MPIGSILAHFSSVNLSTADGKSYSIKMSLINKMAVLVFGTPHIWFRMRARILLSIFKNVPKNKEILDAGCGYGIVSMTLANMGFKNLNLIDLDENRINGINRNISEYSKLQNIKTMIGSLTNLPLQNESFDIVMSSEVIEHIKEDKKAFSELSRVLRKNGTLIITTPEHSKSNSLDYKQYNHEKPGYTIEEFKELAKENNLVIKNVIHYIYTPAKKMIDFLNCFTSKPVVALLFYPLYFLSILDKHLKIGESNSIVVVFEKIT